MNSSGRVTLGRLKYSNYWWIALLAEVRCDSGKQVSDCFLVSQMIELVISKYKSKFGS